MNPIQFEQLQLIRQSAVTCIGAVKESMQITLAYDEESVLAIDSLIDKLWPGGAPEQNSEMRVQVWASFLGEAMCRILNGHWVSTDHGYGVAVGLMVAHPFAKLEKRFCKGMSDSVTHFYEVFKQRTASGA